MFPRSTGYTSLNDDLFDLDIPSMPGSYPTSAVVISRIAEETLQAQDAPIQRLPVETLENIFLHCLEYHFTVLPHVDEAPLLLCRVCRAWRQVATSTPMLWTSIHVQLPPKATLGSLQLGARRWLSRSGALPLAIRIDSHPVYSLPGEFFDTFIPSFTRWSTLQLHLPSKYLPYLLRHSEAWAAQLTRLTLSSVASINDCLDMLGQCPRLQEAVFSRLLESSDPVARPPILLPELHTLKLITRQDVFSCFDILELPLLRHLDIHFYFPQTWDKQRLLSLAVSDRETGNRGPNYPSRGFG